MAFLLAVLAVFVIVIASELWWRIRQPHSELSRKFIHITVGTFVAFWPFFLSWNQIRLLALGFVLAISLSKWLHIFKSIHSVQRPTWGEVYFALVVGLLTFITHSKGIYAAALLQMSLADGLAAVVGVRFGTGNRYRVFGHPKSVIGSLTFCVISLGLLVGYSIVSTNVPIVYLIALPLTAMLIENLGVAGLDNLLVPLLIASLLNTVR